MDTVPPNRNDEHDELNQMKAKDALNGGGRGTVELYTVSTGHRKTPNKTADVIDLSAILANGGHEEARKDQSVKNDLPNVTAGSSAGSSAESKSPPQSSHLNSATNTSGMISNFYRNRVGFWLLGLCNNYAYVIMLSAAEALIKKSEHEPPNDPSAVCNPLSTATILLADIIPSLITKLVSPFINISTRVRVSIAIILTVVSFLLTSFSNGHGMTFAGVICASISSGLGEVTFLAYAAAFEKGVVSFWSSGTGMAGLAGAGLYTLITSLVSVETCLLIMLIVPLIEASTFCFLISRPQVSSSRQSLLGVPRGDSPDQLTDERDVQETQAGLSLREKISFARPLVLRYMVPLGLVYFFEYFINQGLSELIYFEKSSIPRDRQYPWYQTMYQLGVFISRSSVLIYRIDKLWLLPILQGLNVLLLLMHILFPYFTSIGFVMAVIAYEGLLGGAAYVNTFYKIRVESDDSSRSFNMAFVALADSMGILAAALLAIPAHNVLCAYMESRHR